MNNKFEEAFSYPNGCLKNRYNIQDPQALQSLEYTIVNHKMLILFYKPYKVQNLDDLSKINEFLFEDLYDWAGKVRTDYDLHKNTNGLDFYAQPAETIPIAWRYINDHLLKPILDNSNPTIDQYVEALDNINTLHPYREGNGRTIRTFLQLLAKQKGQYLRFPVDQMKLIDAMNKADYEGMKAELKLYKFHDELRKQDEQVDDYFNDHEKTIAGEKIKSLVDYRLIKDSVLFNIYEAWCPKQQEIDHAINVAKELISEQ